MVEALEKGKKLIKKFHDGNLSARLGYKQTCAPEEQPFLKILFSRTGLFIGFFDGTGSHPEEKFSKESSEENPRDFLLPQT